MYVILMVRRIFTDCKNKSGPPRAGQGRAEPQDASGQVMDGCLQTDPKLPVWIIEHVWAHKMMDIQKVVDPCLWPDVDSQPLSLEDSWRLRVASAQAYSIVRRRDVELFEKVMVFLEATHRLLPGLVPAIKHMKIMFGLKTMVIMWMLRERRGMIDTASKIVQFFPNKLPQYQDQCSQHEMFLMRKNHLDFKSLAQTLAVDKDRREDYITTQMEEQYGEHYAQKVEDRLLHYLRELETVIPGDTYIDKILKKENPVTEEEKLLLDVITSDSTTIASTLKTLLNCDVASCRAATSSRPPERGGRGVEASRPPPHGSSSKVLLLSGEPEVFRDLLPESPLHSGDGGRHDEPEQAEASSSSPQFCSKHQRWVKSILRECPDESSEELLLHTSVSLSPPLFPSSSSASSSQDLTPSDLIPLPPHQPPSQTSTQLHTAASEESIPGDQLSSGPSQTERLPQPSLSSKTPLSSQMSPVVRLVDIGAFKTSADAFNLHRASQTSSISKQAASAPGPQRLTPSVCHSSGKKRRSRRIRHSGSQSPLAEPFLSTCTSSCSPLSSDVSEPSARVSTSTSQSGSLSSASADNRIPSSARSRQRNVSSSSSRVLRNQLRLSLQSQDVLLQSKLLQPYVGLTKMSAEECYRATDGRCCTEHEEAESSFDLNCLYSSDSLSSDEDSHDPDYKPRIKKKRLLLEYENASDADA